MSKNKQISKSSPAPTGLERVKTALVLVCCLAVLGVLAATMFVMPLQEKSALINAGLTYKDGAVVLGTYEQDGDESNGAEDIVWRVMKMENDKAYLIAKEGLDVKAFNAENHTGNPWETSDLKAWLETEFATTAGLQEKTITVTLPTTEEAEACFDMGADRAVTPTAYALEKEPSLLHSNTAPWWLRTNGSNRGSVAVVGEAGSLTDTGKINTAGRADTDETVVVRPMLVVNLK